MNNSKVLNNQKISKELLALMHPAMDEAIERWVMEEADLKIIDEKVSTSNKNSEENL